MDGKRTLLLLLFRLLGGLALSDVAMSEAAKTGRNAVEEDRYAAGTVILNACRRPVQSDDKPINAICDPLVADVVSTSKIGKPTGRGLHLRDDVEASKSNLAQELSPNSMVEIADGRLRVAKSYGRQPKAVIARESSPEVKTGRASSESVRRDVIPGSLLVTILALVGIVAVARRDMPEKRAPRLVERSGSGVAKIPPLRHNRPLISDQMPQL